MQTWCNRLIQMTVLFWVMPVWAELDEPMGERAWLSFRNMSPTDYQTKLDIYKAKGYRPIDVEVKGGSKPKYALIMRKNTENLRWKLHTTLKDKAFSDKLTTYRKQGYRLIDQETYRRAGNRYYGGLWVKNPKTLKWASYRRLTSEAYNQKHKTLKKRGLMPIDVDGYTIGGRQYFSGVWVEKSEAKDWAVRRNLSGKQFGQEFKSYRAKGYRLYDTESYRFKKRQYFAAIWVKDKKTRKWAAYRDMNNDEFHNEWAHFVDRGYRLVDVEAYSVGSKTRYAAVWVQNNNLVQWSHRKAVQKIVEDYHKANPSAGLSVVVAHKGKVVFRQGWGHQKRKSNDAHSGTVFRLASISKAITGILGFRLQKKGKITLSRKTRSYESRLPSHHTHTILELLANRGHVRHYNGKEPDHKNFNSAYAASAIFHDDPLVGDNYLYSTHGYTLVAAAYEAATRKTFCALITTYLSDPHGLGTLRCENRKRKIQDRSTLYAIKSSGSGFRKIARPENLSWKYAGGGLESSAYDLARLGIVLERGGLLSQGEITSMTTPPDSLRSYAYGWEVGQHKSNAFYEKRGDQEGARSIIRIYPKQDIVVVMLSNTRGKSSGMKSPVKKIAQRLF